MDRPQTHYEVAQEQYSEKAWAEVSEILLDLADAQVPMPLTAVHKTLLATLSDECMNNAEAQREASYRVNRHYTA